MACSDAIIALGVIAILASISTVVMATTSILFLWKPHLIPKLVTPDKKKHRNTKTFSGSGAGSSSKSRIIDDDEDDEHKKPLSHTPCSVSMDTSSTLHLTTIQELEESEQLTSSSSSSHRHPPPPPPLHLLDSEKTGFDVKEEEKEENDGEEEEEEGRGGGGGGKENFGSVPTSPLDSEPAETRVRKRSRVSLSSLAESISSKLGSLHPRRTPSGGNRSVAEEESRDLMRERSEERSTSPSSGGCELDDYRDFIFSPTSLDGHLTTQLGRGAVEVVAGEEEGDEVGGGEERYIIKLDFDQGESAV